MAKRRRGWLDPTLAFVRAIEESPAATASYGEQVEQVPIPPATTEETSTRKRGPGPMTTLAEVEATRAKLASEDHASGERSIASALGVSRDAVRYALGKDRRRPAR